jgi:tRNA-uridine 2-sulfurtransferase
MAKKVVVGMSGGVDSSVAAYLLKKQGYDVIGVTMQIWQDEDEFTQEKNGGCCGLSAVDDARRVADRLEIPYYVMNFKQEFKKNVMDYFTAEYLKGRTPNPCIACNRYVKWEALLDRSLAIGADYIATGHYARIEQLPNGRYAIKNSVTAAKDQTSDNDSAAGNVISIIKYNCLSRCHCAYRFFKHTMDLIFSGTCHFTHTSTVGITDFCF